MEPTERSPARGVLDAHGYAAERIPAVDGGRRLNVIHGLADTARSRCSPVLYVHGSTFPASPALGWRFDGRSWLDALCAAGFDFLGFGASDRYTEMALPAETSPPLGRAALAARQLERVARHVLAATGARRVSRLAHSWDSQPAGRFAGKHPDLVDRLALLGPIVERQPEPGGRATPALPAYTFISGADQWQRFKADAPADRPVLLERHFARWCAAYLATDPASHTRQPPSVQTPAGPGADIAAGWQGQLACEPGKIRAPTLLVGGEWNSLCDDRDAGWLRAHLTRTPLRDCKLPGGTHLMHLEESRFALWRAVRDFLAEADA